MPQHEKDMDEPQLTPGLAFRLQPDGSWAVENLPHQVLTDATFSGYLTIQGYRSSVFEMPDKSMWAQKSVNTPATASAKKHAEPDMSIKCPECGGRATDVRGYCACCKEGHFFDVKPSIASGLTPGEYGRRPLRALTQLLTSEWVKPTIDDEIDELERLSAEEGIDLETLKAQFTTAKPVPLTEADWGRLENTDSYDIKNLSEANETAASYKRDLNNIVQGFRSGELMKMPVVYERDDGTITLVGGNTRLMASRALGIQPTVLWISNGESGLMDTIASRVASTWFTEQFRCGSCRNFAFHGAGQVPVERSDGLHHPACPKVIERVKIADRASDIVSQVNDILEGSADGPFGHDDVAYDKDIAKWCERVVDKLPEMQEIFDAAFHQVMDFKDKVPASDNPRVRQIADERIAKMLNEAAARLEIISHGLMEEIQVLCTDLAAGAAASEEMTPTQISSIIRQIAAAIDNSKNPSRKFVVADLKKVLSAI